MEKETPLTGEKLTRSIDALKRMRQYCEKQIKEPRLWPGVRAAYDEQAEIYTTAIKAMETILYILQGGTE